LNAIGDEKSRYRAISSAWDATSGQEHLFLLQYKRGQMVVDEFAMSASETAFHRLAKCAALTQQGVDIVELKTEPEPVGFAVTTRQTGQEQLILAYAVFEGCVVQLSKTGLGQTVQRVRHSNQLDLADGEKTLCLAQLREHLGSRQSPELCLVTPMGVSKLPNGPWEGSDDNVVMARLFSKLKDAFHFFWSGQQAPLDRIMQASLSQLSQGERDMRNEAILEYSRSEVLQAGDFGHMSFHEKGDQSENQMFIIDMLEEKMQRHIRFVEFLKLEGKLSVPETSLFESLSDEHRHTLLGDHQRLQAGLQLRKFQNASQRSVHVNLAMDRAVLKMRERARAKLPGGCEMEESRPWRPLPDRKSTAQVEYVESAEEMARAGADPHGSFNQVGAAGVWFYQYVWHLPGVLDHLESVQLEAAKEGGVSGGASRDEVELTLAVNDIFDAILSTALAHLQTASDAGWFEEQQGPKPVPKLLFVARNRLFAQMMRTSQLLYNCANFAPDLSKSLEGLTTLYLLAMRAHAQPFTPTVFPFAPQSFDSDKLRQELAIRPFLTCDLSVARKLAEEFEDCPSLVRLCLEDPNRHSGTAALEAYAAKYDYFLEHLFCSFLRQGRLGDALTTAERVEAGGRVSGLGALQAFLNGCSPDAGCDYSFMQKVERLGWLLQVQGDRFSDSVQTIGRLAVGTVSGRGLGAGTGVSLEDGTMEMGTSTRRRIHAAIGLLSGIASSGEIERGPEIEKELTAELKKQNAVQMHVYPRAYSKGITGIGNYPVKGPANDEIHKGLLQPQQIARDCMLSAAHSESPVLRLKLGLEILDIKSSCEDISFNLGNQAVGGDFKAAISSMTNLADPCRQALLERYRIWRAAIEMNAEEWNSPHFESEMAGRASHHLVFLKLAREWFHYQAARSGEEAKNFEYNLLDAQLLLDSTMEKWLSEEEPNRQGSGLTAEMNSNVRKKLYDLRRLTQMDY